MADRSGAQARRFVLHPGDVISRNDGDRHYIGATTLARLYGVRMAQCVIYPAPDDPLRQCWRDPPEAIHLFPRFDGDYSLPSEAQL